MRHEKEHFASLGQVAFGVMKVNGFEVDVGGENRASTVVGHVEPISEIVHDGFAQMKFSASKFCFTQANDWANFCCCGM